MERRTYRPTLSTVASIILSLTLLPIVGVGQSQLTRAERASLSKIDNLTYSFDQVIKKIDESMWFDLVGDLAYIDKVRLTGPPKTKPAKTGNEFRDQFLDNDLIFYSYIFLPKEMVQGRQYPLIVFAHGGIHGTFSTVYSHIVRELLSQGYIIIAPDYRGSTGYGKGFHQSIDYGGRENEDVLAARDYMVKNYSIVDPTRIGMLGWSHGGMITLMNILKYPDSYTCGYAGVPVSDVTYRLEYQTKGYTKLFSAPHHIGKTPQEDPAEYARRSPVSYASLLKRPLMITTTKNDNDVSYKEVERMIDSLKQYNKEFEYKIYDALPGSHLFERIDTQEATAIRLNVYLFLAKYLSPQKPITTIEELRKCGYRYY
ncbi:MAG: alpha/beta fold hydrolase [Bacteroidales bacterium]